MAHLCRGRAPRSRKRDLLSRATLERASLSIFRFRRLLSGQQSRPTIIRRQGFVCKSLQSISSVKCSRWWGREAGEGAYLFLRVAAASSSAASSALRLSTRMISKRSRASSKLYQVSSSRRVARRPLIIVPAMRGTAEYSRRWAARSDEDPAALGDRRGARLLPSLPEK